MSQKLMPILEATFLFNCCTVSFLLTLNAEADLYQQLMLICISH